MPTTTIKLIRKQQATLIRALVPASLSANEFREYDRHTDFGEWAEATPESCLRKFFIEDEGEYEPPLSSNTDNEEIVTLITVLVAYPAGPSDARYGKGGQSARRDVMREDMHQIDTAIGHRGSDNYVSGHRLALAQTKEFEEGENVDFLAMDYEINFRRAF